MAANFPSSEAASEKILGTCGMVRDVTRVGLVIDDVKAFTQSMYVVAMPHQR
jgi:hypothetical protein